MKPPSDAKILLRYEEPINVQEVSKGFDVEIDLWEIDGHLRLGHDFAQYEISLDFLIRNKDNLWIHCKNLDALYFCQETTFNYFWHEEDTVTLTSMGVLWVYPGKQPIKGSIAVMPEIHNDDVSICLGICSDYIERYK